MIKNKTEDRLVIELQDGWTNEYIIDEFGFDVKTISPEGVVRLQIHNGPSDTMRLIEFLRDGSEKWDKEEI